MVNPRTTTAGVASVLLGLFVAGCGDTASDSGTASEASEPADTNEPNEPVIDPGDNGNYAPDVEPADFVDTIDNPYLPLTPGSRWVYEGESEEGLERVEVEVLEERRDVMGISAVAVKDLAYLEGELVEETDDWFAQDTEGNVWYLGEETAEYEDGEVVNTEGAWEGGVDRALPGIVMPAEPMAGDTYRQEYYEGEAEDMGEVLEVGVTQTIDLGTYEDVLVTQDWTPLEPEVTENKYYAPDVGLIYETHVAGATGELQLIEHSPAQ